MYFKPTARPADLNFTSFSRWIARRCMSVAAEYPFSKVVATTSLVPPTPEKDALQKGRGLMTHIRKSLIDPQKQHMIDVLFSRRHPDRIKPGTVVTVTTQHAPFKFSGVLVSMRRRGPDTSFVVRNIVQKIGIEAQFFVNSPHLKSVSAVRRAVADRKAGRAKMYELRHDAKRMTRFASGVKA